jgi:hypothetical protein
VAAWQAITRVTKPAKPHPAPERRRELPIRWVEVEPLRRGIEAHLASVAKGREGDPHDAALADVGPGAWLGLRVENAALVISLGSTSGPALCHEHGAMLPRHPTGQRTPARGVARWGHSPEAPLGTDLQGHERDLPEGAHAHSGYPNYISTVPARMGLGLGLQPDLTSGQWTGDKAPHRETSL